MLHQLINHVSILPSNPRLQELKVISVTGENLITTAPNYFCFSFVPFLFCLVFFYLFRYIYVKQFPLFSEALLNDHYWGNLSMILSLLPCLAIAGLCVLFCVLDVFSVYLGNEIPETWGLALKGEVCFGNHILVISAIRGDAKEFSIQWV